MRIRTLGRSVTLTVALALAAPLAPALAAPAVAVQAAPVATATDASVVSTYVNAVYRDLLGRGADSTGLATWTSAIMGGSPLRSVANSITASAEFRGTLIEATYRDYLGRGADPTGMQTWQNSLRAGRTIQDIEVGFVASAEFYSKAGGTSTGWVGQLYRTVLGRTAGTTEVGHWVSRLAAGASRHDVARGFVMSSERLSTVVDRYYGSLLGRSIDPDGRATWVRQLQSGTRIEAVIGSILSSAEYVRRVTGTVIDIPTPGPNPNPAPRPGGRPGADNTGVPAGTQLTVHQGDLTITKAGTVIDSMDIRGFVTVKAANVVIKNSIIRGRDTTGFTSTRALVSSTNDAYSVTVMDSELAPTHPSSYIDGLRGWNITAQRVNIHHVIDSAHFWGAGNVVLEDSWLHDNLHLESDPQHNGGASHDDSIQIQQGSNIRIRNNTISGAYNTGIQFTQDRGVVSDVHLTGNFLDGGGCTVNFAEKDRGAFQGIVITGNTFGRTTKIQNCAIIAKDSTRALLTVTDNVYIDGAAVTVRRG